MVDGPPVQKKSGFNIQHSTFTFGVDALRYASENESSPSLRNDLCERLHYNSKETRKRLGSHIFFWALDKGDFSAIQFRVWRSYKDEELLKDVLRERYLTLYPPLGDFVTRYIDNADVGSEVDKRSIETILESHDVTAMGKGLDRTRTTMRDLGFLLLNGRRPPIVLQTTLPAAAFLILMHFHFAQTPRTISVGDILANPFWRYLGGRNDNEVRNALNRAAATDMVLRYSNVDGLDQVTTRYSLDDLLERQARI